MGNYAHKYLSAAGLGLARRLAVIFALEKICDATRRVTHVPEDNLLSRFKIVYTI